MVRARYKKIKYLDFYKEMHRIHITSTPYLSLNKSKYSNPELLHFLEF